uniref:Uncharacterized protein n=1 Tax=Tanacetum cinerariifolium TaxID=118510 RepID=A0A6L2JT92_TANCI|nr:hypothetical protein [Tanacetum cinerariifolium]
MSRAYSSSQLLAADVLVLVTFQMPIGKWTHRTLSAPMSPKPKNMFQTLKGKLVGESSEPRKPIRIKVKHPQPAHISFMVPVLTLENYEELQVHKAKDLILAPIDDAIHIEQVEQMDKGEDVEADIVICHVCTIVSYES